MGLCLWTVILTSVLAVYFTKVFFSFLKMLIPHPFFSDYSGLIPFKLWPCWLWVLLLRLDWRIEGGWSGGNALFWSAGLSYEELSGCIAQRSVFPYATRATRWMFLWSYFTVRTWRGCLHVKPKEVWGSRRPDTQSFSLSCKSTISLQQFLKLPFKCSFQVWL